MVFKIAITHNAHIDTLEGIEWYNKQSSIIGKRFYQTLQKKYKTLSQNPYFQIRYENVPCLPLAKFPYLIHYVVEEHREQIVIIGIICTYRNPERWKSSRKK